jgi:hypothetical protein
MILSDFKPLGGEHAESTNIANCLNYQGLHDPVAGRPFSEALCFGIAGGIGIGYSFCPSVIRHGAGCGVSLVGRHKIYSTSGAWYRDFADRLRIHLTASETTAAKKAYRNLVEELQQNRPTVVFTSRHDLPFLGCLESMFNVGMHSFVVSGIDEARGIAVGADIGSQPVMISLDQLAEARNRVCSHKNRIAAFDLASQTVPVATLQDAIRLAIPATAQELLAGKMKTFSLPGLEMCARAMVNDKAADGWLKVLPNGLIYDALRNLFDSIETCGSGTGLYRKLYAEFLDEAAVILEKPSLRATAEEYRKLAARWTEFAELTLPNRVKPFKQTKKLLRKQHDALRKKGSKGQPVIDSCVTELREIAKQVHSDFPLSGAETRSHLAHLRDEILELGQQERIAATRLGESLAG